MIKTYPFFCTRVCKLGNTDHILFAEIPYGISNGLKFQGSLFRDPEELKKSIGHKDHTPETLY